MSEREVKQVIVIRRDLKMRRGKEIAQGAHASMAWLTDRLALESAGLFHNSYYAGVFSPAEVAWMKGLFTKVVCQVDGEEELKTIVQDAVSSFVTVRAINDAGKTEFHGVETLTAVAVGPDYADVVDLVTGHLKLY